MREIPTLRQKRAKGWGNPERRDERERMGQPPKKLAKIVLICLLGGTSLFTLAASIYIPFHYAAVMPRSPQPETGRIYPIKAQYGVVVYVNKKELDRRDFVRYYLTSVCGVGGLLFFFLGTRLGWFKRGTRFGGNSQFGQ